MKQLFIGCVCSLITRAVCSPCQVKQRCVSRNERGECTSEEPEVKECCRPGYNQQCKAEKEKAEVATGKEIDKVADRLEAIEDELERLSDQLALVEKDALNP